MVMIVKLKNCKICEREIYGGGELCYDCREGLARFKKKTELLQAAIYYLNPMEKIR